MTDPQKLHIGTRIFSGLMVPLFLLSAWVQINDPDPAAWIAVYSIAAILSGVSAADRPAILPVNGLYFLGVALWIGILGVAVLNGAATPMFPEGEMTGNALVDFEEHRELGGLVIVEAAMLVILINQAIHKFRS